MKISITGLFVISSIIALAQLSPEINLGRNPFTDSQKRTNAGGLRLNVDQNSKDKSYSGYAIEHKGSSFFMEKINGKYKGHLLLGETSTQKKKGYEIKQNTAGDILLRLVDINKLVCTEYQTDNRMLARNLTQKRTSTNIPVFNSKTASESCVYLDFDGYHLPEDHVWNDRDSLTVSSSNLSDQKIKLIWNRVADDYAPFDINVTTSEDTFNKCAKGKRMRVVFTVDHDWYGNDAGGVAYLRSFQYQKDVPCWVFVNKVGYSEKLAAEAASHEVGHTLGLSHDGDNNDEYYRGHGNWAPIMGVSYYKGITQFSRGEYSAASNLENDFEIMKKMVPLIIDQDNSPSTSSPLFYQTTGQNSTLDSTVNLGTIADSADVDWYHFSTKGGQINLSIKPSYISPSNLHFSAILVDSNLNLLDSSATNLSNLSLGVSLSRQLQSGTYYVKIQNEKDLNPTQGFSHYGSVGQYAIMGNIDGASHLFADASELLQLQLDDSIHCGELNTRLVLKNLGTNTVQNLKIAVVASNYSNAFIFPVQLKTGQDTLLKLNSLSLNNGKQNVSFSIIELNGNSYSSNTMSTEVIIGTGNEMEIRSDSWTTSSLFNWHITSNSSPVIQLGNQNVYQQAKNDLIVSTFCLEENLCYELTLENPFTVASCPGFPPFSNDSSYLKDDYFSYNGNIYFVLQPCMGMNPEQNPDYYFNTGPCPLFPSLMYLHNNTKDSLYSVFDTVSARIPFAFCIDLDIEVSTSEPENIPQGLVYPNPFNEQISLQAIGQTYTSYQILDMTGNVIASGDSLQNLNTSTWSKGTYIALFTNAQGGSKAEKLIKK